MTDKAFVLTYLPTYIFFYFKYFQLFEALKESFAQAEALDYLNFHPEGGEKTVTLLGLKAENLMGQHHKKSVYQVCTSITLMSLVLNHKGGITALSIR